MRGSSEIFPPCSDRRGVSTERAEPPGIEEERAGVTIGGATGVKSEERKEDAVGEVEPEGKNVERKRAI